MTQGKQYLNPLSIAGLLAGATLVALLGGCSNEAPSVASSEPNREREELAAIRTEASRANDLLMKRIDALRGDLERVKQSRKEGLAECERRVRLNDRRAQELEQGLKDERALTRRLRQQIEEQKVIATTPRAVVVPRKAEPAPDFPVAVFDIAGKEVIVKTRTRPRAIETEETYRDGYGNLKPVLDWEDVAVNDYEYQVSFSARNLTDQPIRLTARAGMNRETFEVAPHTVLTNATLRSALGSGLFIEAGGKTKRFKLSY